MSSFVRYALLIGALGGYSMASTATLTADISLEDALIQTAPMADPEVIRLAVAATSCAAEQGQPAARRLAVIDYSRPSTEPRLWVFDLTERRKLFTELVAHGRNSGENYARSFSNAVGSYASSLGLFRTQHSYDGHNGYSMRMQGLEAGFNDRAEERAIVMHGAPYVNTTFLRTQGRLGRSLGCPAVRPEVARSLIDTIKDGQYVFSYYPDRKWLASSPYLRCGKSRQSARRSSSPDPRQPGTLFRVRNVD
ncbi:MAG: murein L,D-transpeptidase catalytic domain family protein [Panacagrimonas sp.]